MTRKISLQIDCKVERLIGSFPLINIVPHITKIQDFEKN